jgi:hypothetical protein
VDLAELCIALKTEAAVLPWYLDLRTGEVLLLTPEYEPAEHGGLTAAQVAADPVRFRRVPGASALDAMADMQAFSLHLTDLVLKESLELALVALRPERRFRSALSWLPDTLTAWQRFRQERAEARARRWLGTLGVAPGP